MKNKGFFGLSTGMCCECETGSGEIARGIACKCMKDKEKARWHGICYARISIINIFRY